MKPAILVALLFRTLDAFRVFDSIFIMTRGALDTESVSILGYNQLISRLNLGLGSAVSVLIFVCVFLIALRLRQAASGPSSTKAGREAEMERRSRDYALWSIAIAAGAGLRPDPRALADLALAEAAGRAIADQRFIPTERLLRQLQEPVRRRHRRQPLHQAADQLDRDRADHDRDRDRPRLLLRLRDRPARIPRQAADPRRGAGDRDVPADLHRRPAVRHVAGARPLRHLSGADHPLPHLLAAAGDLRPRRLLPGDPLGPRAGGPGRRRDPVPGLHQGDRAAGRARASSPPRSSSSSSAGTTSSSRSR